MSKIKKICALTMARNDDFFLTRWIDYYRKHLGEQHLYVFLDGEDQLIPKNAGKANVRHRKRVVEHVVRAEKRRLGFLSEVAAELLQHYDLIIGVDADEFLAVDPRCGKSLVEYLSEIKIEPSVSGLGLDVGQKLGEEAKLDAALPFLVQRRYALVSSRYTKPSVISRPVSWGSGFHRVLGHNFNIDPNLYLLHFGSVDYDIIQQRFLDKDRMATGRKRHIEKRAKTVDIVTKKKAQQGDIWLPWARSFQTWVRPPYAWNKPGMASWKLVIKLPESFRNIV